MDAYRISRSAYIRDLSGEGARRYGGRWNRKGHPVLYTAEHASLAILETLVHSSINALPNDLCIAKIHIPDDIKTMVLKEEELPENWRQYPAPNILADRGAEWLNKAKSLVMMVPSAVVPSEWNILLNPVHPEFEGIKLDGVRDFSLDRRLAQ